MIVPSEDIRLILKGGLGEVVTDDPPTVGAVCWVRETLRVEPACRARVVDVWAHVAGGFVVQLERVDDATGVQQRPALARPALALTRTQRAKLFNRECPHIGGEGRCPVEPGEELRLSARVTLKVLRVDVKAGRWKLHYELRDARDPVRLLRRTPPAHREGSESEHPTPGALRDASEQSNYTSSPRSAVPGDAGEAPPRVWLEVRAKTVREFETQRRLAQQAQELRAKSKSKRKRAA